MAFVAAPNIVQVEWRYTMFGQQCENRLMINNFAPPTQADLDGYALRGWTWWVDTYSAHIADSVNLREVKTTDMGLQNGSISVYAPSSTVFGQVLGGQLPNETSFCVTLNTSNRGRSARGRWFVAGVPDIYRQDANNITTVHAGEYVSALQVLINLLTSISKAAVIVSRVSNGAPRPGGPVYFIVDSASFSDTVLDSQRRRKPGVGI